MESINDLSSKADYQKSYPLVSENDPILHEPIEDYDFINRDETVIDPIQIADILAYNLLEKGGVGLAANQIGFKYRALVLKSTPMVVMFNPKIVHSEGEFVNEEGCLSYPGLFMKIKRATEVRVRFTQPNGETITETYTGLTARIIQHEIDHLNGITFRKRASLYEKNKGDRKRKKLLDKAKKGIV